MKERIVSEKENNVLVNFLILLKANTVILVAFIIFLKNRSSTNILWCESIAKAYFFFPI